MTSPPGREPIFNLPGIVTACIGTLLVVHAARALLPDETDLALLLEGAVIPARFLVRFGWTTAEAVLAEVAGSGGGPDRIALARFVLAGEGGGAATLVSHALLHASWPHLAFNCLWLAAFGAPVARRCGALRFLALAAIGAVGGALAQIASLPWSIAPMLGASTAVSGLMGAAVWFMFAPPSAEPDEAHQRPRQGLDVLVRSRGAVLFVLVWFVTTILFGLVPAPLAGLSGEIAWQAHLGGFVAGFLVFPLLDPTPPQGEAA